MGPQELADLTSAVRQEEEVRFFSLKRLDLRISPKRRDFSPFNQLSLSALNLSPYPVFIGMKLVHGADSGDHEDRHVSFSGGREELAPGVWQDIKFPIECFGAYGFPAGWSDIREIQLIFTYERGHTGPKEIEIALRSLHGEFRDIPPGPRLTQKGLASALRVDIDEALAPPFPSHNFDDLGLLILAPHQYLRETADEILAGKIMGQKVGNPIQWGVNPLGELEWTHFLHRHHFLKDILAALSSSRNEYYAGALDRIIAGWIRDNPAPLASNGGAGPSWETLSVGWRLREWLWVRGIAWNYRTFSRETRLLTLRSIWEHARSLMDHKGHPNNWIIVESAALALAGICFPEFRDAEGWFETGVQRLSAEFNRQFFPDGAHFEISPMYHAICFHALTEVKAAAAARNIDLPKEFDEPLEKCAGYLLALCRPNFTWPSINDSGSVDGDYSALMRKAAEVFQRDDFMWVGTRGLAGEPPGRTFHVFPDAGIAAMRSSWDRDANFLVFRAGPPGATHIHGDSLSVEVIAFGEPRLVDPGITKYAPDVLTDYYRSALAHNQLLIDGHGPDRAGIDWEKKIASAGQDFASWSDNSLKVVSGIYRGPWESIDEEFAHERTVVFINDQYWLVKDAVTGSDEHEISACWQFFPGRVETDIKTLATLYVDARGSCFELIPLHSQDPVEIEVFTGSLHPPRGWVSVGGADQPATRITYSIRTKLPTCLIWLLSPFSGTGVSRMRASRQDAKGGIEIEIAFPEGYKDVIRLGPEMAGNDRIRFDRVNNSD
jgi:hypothetical protein